MVLKSMRNVISVVTSNPYCNPTANPNLLHWILLDPMHLLEHRLYI